MNRIGIVLFACSFAVPAFAAKKSTVEELRQTLIAMQQNRKSDIEVAGQLKQLDLSEQLTEDAAKSLASYLPGEQSIEQVNVLEVRTALLPPPDREQPKMVAPDLAAQRSILARAIEFVTKNYMQNPHVTALKNTSRYQDGVEGIHTSSGMTNNMPGLGRSWEKPDVFLHFLGTHADLVESDKGIELPSAAKQKSPWGQNGQISEGGPGPMLNVILQEATAGKLAWLRWQTVQGKTVAVFSFIVPKKLSHYSVNYCCFPVTQDAGRMGNEGTEANFQTGTEWKAFKSQVGYHGTFFIEPESGVMVRVITQAELKPTDFVHQEDMRIDYAPVTIDGLSHILPVHSYILTEVVPNGDNYAARYSVRHTLFEVSYSGYRLKRELEK